MVGTFLPEAFPKTVEKLTCGYDDEECIDEDTVMSSPGESDIDDDDLCDISPNFIAEAADLSPPQSAAKLRGYTRPREVATPGQRT
jgi:hypothetical protein